MAATEQKNLNSPDETRPFGHGKMETVQIGGGTVGKGTFEPGWKWSNDVKPIAGTESCQAPHFGFMVSGRMTIAMDDGSQTEYSAGDVAVIPPGHDAWVVGDEACVFLDWGGATNYAKQ